MRRRTWVSVVATSVTLVAGPFAFGPDATAQVVPVSSAKLQPGSSIAVRGGTLGFESVPLLEDIGIDSVVVTGSPQITPISVPPFVIVDATGSGAGWHVRLTVPDLVNGVSTISSSNIFMPAPIVTPVGGSDPTKVVGHPTSGHLANGEDIVTAKAGFGMGTYVVTPRTGGLIVPSTAMSGTYVSTITVELAKGP